MQPAVGDLRDDLKKSLPDYMVPTAWVFLPTLPLTPNGKVDRKALPMPDQQRPAQADHQVCGAARTETEKTLARIWADVLGAKAVGIHDDYFELGGHFDARREFDHRARSNEAFGIRLPLISLFHAPTIAQFSVIVEKEHYRRAENRRHVDPAEIIAQQVRQFIVENYLDGTVNGLKDSDSFLEHEIIDPMRLYELVEFMEETFGIRVENDALTGANLDSIESVSRFLTQRLSRDARDVRSDAPAFTEHDMGEIQWCGCVAHSRADSGCACGRI